MELQDWLAAERVSLVVWGTADYWRDAVHLLDGCPDLILVNAAHAKGLRGRTTDVSDAASPYQMDKRRLLKSSIAPERNAA